MEKTNNVPLVSCITTTYKKFKYLFETLDSIFEQTYTNIEVVIGDDGSENFPENEIRKYIDDHKKGNISNVVILHSETNRGTVQNCCACRDAASGKYIMGIASDDRFYSPEVVSDVVKCFETTGADVIACKRQFIDEASDRRLAVMPYPKQQKWLDELSADALFGELASFGFLCGANTYYTNECYKKLGGYDQGYKYFEDCPFYLKVLRNNIKIHFLDRISILYRYGAGVSVNSEFRMQMYKDRALCIEKEVIPYMDNFPSWRKAHIRVRLRRFKMEADNPDMNKWRKYLQLFIYSPIGTIVQLYYQIDNKINFKRYAD